jgi:predicted O-methyltransferase YrrM
MAPIYERYASVYDAFAENVERAGLRDAVVPFRGSVSQFAAAAPAGFKCRVAFVDGDHGYRAVCNDIEQVERFLVPGGWICLDDAFASYASVDRAVEDRILRNPNYELGQQLTRKLFAARRKSTR